MSTVTAPDSAFNERELLPETLSTRKIGRAEKILGPENYRIVKGLLTTPTSIAGLLLIVFFVVVAALAPVIAPPRTSDAYKIPRDGFSPDPRPMGSEWKVRQPPLPVWWKPIMGTDQWTHLMGTASGQWDIFYGVIWGTRTAFKTGLLITFTVMVIGMTVGSIAAYYGGLGR